MRSAILNLALLLLGLLSTSSSVGSIGFLVITFIKDFLPHWQIQSPEDMYMDLPIFNFNLIILSPREWKVIRLHGHLLLGNSLHLPQIYLGFQFSIYFYSYSLEKSFSRMRSFFAGTVALMISITI